MVDVLDDSGLAQAGGLEAAFEALVLTLDRLAIDHHGETFLEGERGDIGLAALVFERLCHDGEPECDQAIMGGMISNCSGSWFADNASEPGLMTKVAAHVSDAKLTVDAPLVGMAGAGRMSQKGRPFGAFCLQACGRGLSIEILGQSTRASRRSVASRRHRLALSCARTPQHQIGHPSTVRVEPVGQLRRTGSYYE